MNIEEIREYCLAKPAVTEGFPFNDTALVFKVALSFVSGQTCFDQKTTPNKGECPNPLPGYFFGLFFCNTLHKRPIGGHDFTQAIFTQYDIFYNQTNHTAGVLAETNKANDSDFSVLHGNCCRKNRCKAPLCLRDEQSLACLRHRPVYESGGILRLAA